ncbi:hypothetical protein AMS68_005037 [Peltaster fructicola]|uniref:Uncharacterized protein n=1 Tax=Peltaster fructicola TaxID=286661 RepID=A0A6H0XYM6_9PEZI|nr:hypothetical protein AMS68_005037 [Peltaster fructicola]
MTIQSNSSAGLPHPEELTNSEYSLMDWADPYAPIERDNTTLRFPKRQAALAAARAARVAKAEPAKVETPVVVEPTIPEPTVIFTSQYSSLAEAIEQTGTLTNFDALHEATQSTSFEEEHIESREAPCPVHAPWHTYEPHTAESVIHCIEESVLKLSDCENPALAMNRVPTATFMGLTDSAARQLLQQRECPYDNMTIDHVREFLIYAFGEGFTVEALIKIWVEINFIDKWTLNFFRGVRKNPRWGHKSRGPCGMSRGYWFLFHIEGEKCLDRLSRFQLNQLGDYHLDLLEKLERWQLNEPIQTPQVAWYQRLFDIDSKGLPKADLSFPCSIVPLAINVRSTHKQWPRRQEEILPDWPKETSVDLAKYFKRICENAPKPLKANERLPNFEIDAGFEGFSVPPNAFELETIPAVFELDPANALHELEAIPAVFELDTANALLELEAKPIGPKAVPVTAVARKLVCPPEEVEPETPKRGGVMGFVDSWSAKARSFAVNTLLDFLGYD